MKDELSEAFEKVFPTLPTETQTSIVSLFDFTRQAAERAWKKRTFWQKIKDIFSIEGTPLLDEDRAVIRKWFADARKACDEIQPPNTACTGLATPVQADDESKSPASQ